MGRDKAAKKQAGRHSLCRAWVIIDAAGNHVSTSLNILHIGAPDTGEIMIYTMSLVASCYHL